MEEIAKQMKELIDAMEKEYEANKESALYLELYEKFYKAEEAYEAAKKEEETFWDEYNNRPKRCIYCNALKGEVGNGPCPLAPASIAKKN